MNSFIKKISVIVPVRNEEENIVPLYQRLKSVLDVEAFDWELIFIEDSSTDKTVETIQKLGVEDLKAKIIELKKELMKLNAQKSTGSSLKNPGQIRQTKKNIARLMALFEEKSKTTRGKTE